MKDYTKKQRTLIILGVAVFILIGSGITYAALTWSSDKINIGLTSGCFEINYTPGGAINNANVEIMDESTLISNNKFTITEGIALTYANIGIKSTCSIEGYGSLYLNVTSLSSAFTTGESKGSLKYAILNNTSSSTTLTVAGLKGQSFDIIKTGTITSTGTVNILNKKLSNTVQNKYLIVFYIDGSKIGNDVVGSTFAGNISADAHQGQGPVNTVELLTELYTNATKTTTTLDGVTYNLASSVGLMNDRKGSMSTGIDAGNIRYYGASPNNYIYFNCSDYNNQSSSTCETWRIIGVFDGKVKIMRNENIGGYSWDTSDSSTNSRYGVNEWSDADLMKLLNSGYDSESVGGSLYWNAKSGTCYNNYDNATTSCNFTSTGLKNDTTRNMIAETTYYTRGHNSNSIYVGAMYDKERVSGTVYDSTRSTTWTGKVAIPYPSDYGYATDLSLCQKKLNSYNDETCTANNWMKNILGADSWGQLLTSNPESAYIVWFVDSDGYIDHAVSSACDAHGVVPVLSLNSELDIKLGTGTSSDPYQLSV